jgi:hypothetical protein
MPDLVERRSEDSFGGLDRELRPPGGPRRRNREGIRLEIGAVKKLRRVHRDTIPVMNPLEFGDKVWGDNRSHCSLATILRVGSRLLPTTTLLFSPRFSSLYVLPSPDVPYRTHSESYQHLVQRCPHYCEWNSSPPLTKPLILYHSAIKHIRRLESVY